MKKRAQTTVRNNQMLQRLGVTALASILNSLSAKGKGTAREDSGSLYELGHNEDDAEGVVDKVFAVRSIWMYFFLHLFNMSCNAIQNIHHLFLHGYIQHLVSLLFDHEPVASVLVINYS